MKIRQAKKIIERDTYGGLFISKNIPQLARAIKRFNKYHKSLGRRNQKLWEMVK